MRPTVEQLGEIEWFRRVGPSLVEHAAEVCRIDLLDRDEVLYRATHPPDAFFVLLHGRVGAWRGGPTHADSMLYFITECRHESLCLENVVARLPYFATMRSLADGTAVLRVPASLLPVMLAADPDLGLAIARHIAVRLQIFTEQMTDLGALPVMRRVAKYLLDQLTPDSDLVVIPLRQAELASRLGAARQSVNQSLATLAHRGIVEVVGRGVYHVHDRQTLRTLGRGGTPDDRTPRAGAGPASRRMVGSSGAPDA